MTKPALLAAVSLVVLTLTGGAARADGLPGCVGAPLGSLIICAAADVGKPCQGGGQCYEIRCSNYDGTPDNKIYRCDACATVVASSEECSDYAHIGKPCGVDGGAAICGGRWPHCMTTSAKFVCQIPAAAKPTGPPIGGGAAGTGDGAAGPGAAGTGDGAAGTGGDAAGTSGNAAGTGGGISKSSGCDVVPSPSEPTVIGLGLLAVGIVLFIVDRLRRRGRR